MKDGGSVFPTQKVSHYQQNNEGGMEPVYETTGGLLIRDYIATQNMPEMLRLTFQSYSEAYNPDDLLIKNNWIESAARLSYRAADAMLAEREKE